MFAMNKIIILALFCLFSQVHTASAASYSVGISYKLAHEDADCSADAGRIQELTERALGSTGMNLSGNSDNWKVVQEKSNNGSVKPDDFRKLLEAQTPRFLGGCNKTCRDLCMAGALYYCSCCQCCGGRRRLKVTMDADIDMIQESAKLEAMSLLESAQISCLASDYDVVVDIERS